MTTIADKLTQLNTIKSDIKTAINAKGGSVGNDFTAYAPAISALPIGSGMEIFVGKPEAFKITNYGAAKQLPASFMRYGWTFPTSLVIDGNFTSIGDYAFYQMANLTSVVINSSLTTLGSYSFSDCKKLETITFPSSLTTINSSALAGCSALLLSLIHI